jgi:transcriptional regulator with XRE-family HTH domain
MYSRSFFLRKRSYLLKSSHHVRSYELAARAGMDRSYVSDVERGEASLSVDRLLRICRALGVRAPTIVERIERRAKRPG